jgi:hypothetical protein
MPKTFLLLAIFIVAGYFQAMAQGDLLITPNRVVFEGNKQKETIDLVNMGKDTATFSISFVQKNMKEDGSFVTVERSDTGQMFADPYLKIFPRRVTLAPGEPQAIMLQCRRKADMAAGEYRSHLYFRSEKDYKPLGVKNPASDSTILSVQLIPVYGITIPVIIRSGSVNVSASLSDLKLETEAGASQNLRLTINRTGNISVYGDIIIDYVPLQGKAGEIGTIKGVGVYTCITKRNIIVKLNNTSGKPFINGILKVRYISNGDTKPVVYAIGEMEIK